MEDLQKSTYQVYDYIAKEWTGDCGGGGECADALSPSPHSLSKRELLQSGGRVLVTTKTRLPMPCSCTSRPRCTSDTETSRGIFRTRKRWVAILSGTFSEV